MKGTTAPRSKTLALNTAALTVGRLGSKLLVFLLVRFYTYAMTQAEFGTADLISSVANLLIPVACAGLSGGFFRFAAEARTDSEKESVFSTGLCLLLVSALGFATLSPLLLLIPQFSSYVWLILIYVLGANLHYFVSDFVRAQGHYRLFAAQGILNTALNIAFNLIFLLPCDMGVTGYLLSVVLADLLTSAFLFCFCRLWQHIRLSSANRALLREMLRYCIPMIPATICWWITNASDRYMVTFFRGEAENGLYAAAYKIPNLLVIAAGIFTDAWQFSAVVENRRAEQAKTPEEQIARRRSLTSFFSKIIKGYSAFLFFAAAGLLLLCRPIASVLFDPSFAAAWHYIPTLILATVFSSLSAFTASVYMVERRSVAALVTASIGAAVNIVLNLCLIPSLGAMGAAIATALSYLVVLVVRLASTRRSIPYRYAPVWQLICVSLLTLMAILITADVFGWVVWAALLFSAISALSFVHLLPNVLSYLKERHKKK